MTEKIKNQITKIRDSGICNMICTKEVQYHAYHENLYELVDFIETKPKEYFNFILTGKEKAEEEN